MNTPPPAPAPDPTAQALAIISAIVRSLPAGTRADIKSSVHVYSGSIGWLARITATVGGTLYWATIQAQPPAEVAAPSK